MIIAAMKDKELPLVIRLRNFVGDVVLCIPTLQRLTEAGYGLQIVGKAWAQDLLAGHGWSIRPYASGTLARVKQLRALRRDAKAADPKFDKRLNALTFPFSFSSALEMRLAGLRCLGHSNEGRDLLLARCVKQPLVNHVLGVYWQLADTLLAQDLPPPAAANLQLSAVQRARATSALAQRGIAPGYVVICPFASSESARQARCWPPFQRFVGEQLASLGRPVVICPGPDEESAALRDYPCAVALEGLPLGTYAAVLAGASLVIACDTGPGHMAAAVCAPPLSLLGPTDPSRWRVLGPRVRVLRRVGGWPDEAEVLQAVREMLEPACGPGS